MALQQVGVVKNLYRYPVKSMAGEVLETVTLGWHGVEGDRRFAFRRVQEKGGFPWLNANRLPKLLCYQPILTPEGAPTHVRTPAGRELPLASEELRAELSAAYKAEVELSQLERGTFDEAPLSLLTTETLAALTAATGAEFDARRFRPNIVVETESGEPFPENAWVGQVLVFGAAADAPLMHVAQRDVRCAAINLDPDTAEVNPAVLKAVVKLNEICAGVYGATLRTGQVTVGAPVYVRAV